MTFTIEIPYRSRDESLVDVMSHCRTLGQDETRDVTRQLVFQARIDRGITSAGELLDYLNELDAPGRRALLDEARAACGLPSTEDVDMRERVAVLSRRVSSGSTFPTCPAEDCTAVPVRYGAFYTPDVRRWWCDEHQHLAAPGDLESHGSGLKVAPSGALIPFDPDDDARQAAAAASDRAQREARDAERAVDAEAYAEHAQARDAARNTELPPHLRRVTT